MNQEKIEKELIDLLERRLDLLGLEKEDVETDKSLLAQGILDSMSFLEFISQIEEKFNMEFDLGEMEPSEFNSIDKLAKIVENEK